MIKTKLSIDPKRMARQQLQNIIDSFRTQLCVNSMNNCLIVMARALSCYILSRLQPK